VDDARASDTARIAVMVGWPAQHKSGIYQRAGALYALATPAVVFGLRLLIQLFQQGASIIYGFDYDGTPVANWSATPLPGVREQLAALPNDAGTFVASNQAGPVFRAVLGDAKYPTVEDEIKRIADGLAALHWRPDLLLICRCSGKASIAWYRAEHHAAQEFDRLLAHALGSLQVRTFVNSYYRKPSHGMLAAAARDLRDREVIYIGDLESDRLAAAAAKCRFLDAAEWRAGVRLE